MQVFRLGSMWVKDKSPQYGEMEQADMCNRLLSQVQVMDNNPDYDPLWYYPLNGFDMTPEMNWSQCILSKCSKVYNRVPNLKGAPETPSSSKMQQMSQMFRGEKNTAGKSARFDPFQSICPMLQAPLSDIFFWSTQYLVNWYDISHDISDTPWFMISAANAKKWHWIYDNTQASQSTWIAKKIRLSC